MENFTKSYKPFKFNSSCSEDIYSVTVKKAKEFLENVHPKEVNDRFFLKNQDDFKKLNTEFKSKNINKVLFYSNYSNKHIESLNDEDAIAFLDFEENRIFIEFNENLFNFSNLHRDEKLVSLDLIGGETAREDGISCDPDGDDDEPKVKDINLSCSVESSNDLICTNSFPVSISHTNLVLNFDKCFPQLLSNELINQALEIFNLTSNSSLRLGFDSLGAGCVINHLHFELLWLDDIGSDKLAVERAENKKLFETNLVHLNKEENEISLVSYIFKNLF